MVIMILVLAAMIQYYIKPSREYMRGKQSYLLPPFCGARGIKNFVKMFVNIIHFAGALIRSEKMHILEYVIFKIYVGILQDSRWYIFKILLSQCVKFPHGKE